MSYPNEIKVQVTQADIANGNRNSCTRCPIALAIKRQTGAKTISVGEIAEEAIIDMDFFIIDNVGIDFIDNFDNGNPVEPCSVTLKRL